MRSRSRWPMIGYFIALICFSRSHSTVGLLLSWPLTRWPADPLTIHLYIILLYCNILSWPSISILYYYIILSWPSIAILYYYIILSWPSIAILYYYIILYYYVILYWADHPSLCYIIKLYFTACYQLLLPTFIYFIRCPAAYLVCGLLLFRLPTGTGVHLNTSLAQLSLARVASPPPPSYIWLV